MKKILFEDEALKNYFEWEKVDKKVFIRINKLLDDTRRNPFKGTGQPEPLKHQLKGFWSRRITWEHRLVYKVTDDAIIVVSCKFHY